MFVIVCNTVGASRWVFPEGSQTFVGVSGVGRHEREREGEWVSD